MLNLKLSNKASTQTRIAELKEEVDQATRKLRGAEEQVGRLRRALEEALVEGKARPIEDYRERLHRAEAERAALEGELEALGNAVTRARLSEAEKELGAAKEERATLEARIRERGEALEAALEAVARSWEEWKEADRAASENHKRIRALYSRAGKKGPPKSARHASGLPGAATRAARFVVQALDDMAKARHREANPTTVPPKPPPFYRAHDDLPPPFRPWSR
jgi:chromosome segregation ATPase